MESTLSFMQFLSHSKKFSLFIRPFVYLREFVFLIKRILIDFFLVFFFYRDYNSSENKEKVDILYFGQFVSFRKIDGFYKDIYFDDISRELEKTFSIKRYYLHPKLNLFRDKDFNFNYLFFDDEFRFKLLFFYSKKLSLFTNIALQYYFIVFRNILLKERPKFVIFLNESTPASRACIFLCHELGIKTIGIQHGIIDKNHPFYSNTFRRDPLVNPSFFFVFYENVISFLKKFGPFTNSTKLIVSGDQRFFNLINRKFSKSKLLSKYKLNRKKKKLLFVSNKISPKTYYEDLNELFVLFKKYLSQFEILIKLHPYDEDKTDFKKLIKKYNLNNVFIYEFEDFHELLFLSDIVIVNYSTAIYEAVLLNKKVIQIDFNGKLRCDIANDKICYFAKSSDELKNKLNLIINNQDTLNPLLFRKSIPLHFPPGFVIKKTLLKENN